MTKKPQNPCVSAIDLSEKYIVLENGVELRTIMFRPIEPQALIKVLFFPGWISQINSWRYFLPRLTDEFPVIYVESREKPSSRLPMPNDFSVNAMRNDVVQTIDYLGLERETYVLLGSSLGATSILEAYPFIKNPPLGLILILPNSQFGLPKYSRLLKYTPTFMLPVVKAVAKWIILRYRINPYDVGHHERFITSINAADPIKLRGSALGIIDYNMDLRQISTYSVDSLVIGASQDKEHNQDEIIKIAKSLPKAEYCDLKTFTASHSKQAASVVIKWLRTLRDRHLR